MQRLVAERRARERGGDQEEGCVGGQEDRDEGALGSGAAAGGAKQLHDDGGRDHDGHDEEVRLPPGEVVDGEARDRDGVVAAPQVAVATEHVVRRGGERAHPERKRSESERAEGRPEPSDRPPQRWAAGIRGPEEQPAHEERDRKRGELRPGRGRERNCTEHRELTCHRRSLDRQHDGKQPHARDEVGGALRQHERGVDRRGDRERERGDAHAPPPREEPPREEVDRHRGERKEQGVHELDRSVRGLDAARERDHGRERERVDGSVAVALPTQLEPTSLRDSTRGEHVSQLVRVEKWSFDELRHNAIYQRGNDDDACEGQHRTAITCDGRLCGRRPVGRPARHGRSRRLLVHLATVPSCPLVGHLGAAHAPTSKL